MSSKIKLFFRKWSLPMSMLAGALAYFFCRALPMDASCRHLLLTATTHYIQPVLIFCMLFLSFLKVSPREMRPQWWHLWVLLLQAGWFVLFSILAMHCHHYGMKVLCEGAMLAFICPTATAGAVVTGKLGGSVSGIVSYLMMCNLMVSLLAPAFLPLVQPHAGIGFVEAFWMILGKVFPLLILPLLAAQLVRRFMRRLYSRLMAYPDLAFDLWVVALALAITVTVRSVVHSTVGWIYMLGLALVSGVCCMAQFWMGKRVGKQYGPSQRITAGQAFGQKNTVFVIWLAQVLFDPVTSVVGGFYSVWHNLVNSWQLARKSDEK